MTGRPWPLHVARPGGRLLSSIHGEWPEHSNTGGNRPRDLRRGGGGRRPAATDPGLPVRHRDRRPLRHRDRPKRPAGAEPAPGRLRDPGRGRGSGDRPVRERGPADHGGGDARHERQHDAQPRPADGRSRAVHHPDAAGRPRQGRRLQRQATRPGSTTPSAQVSTRCRGSRAARWP